MSMPKELENLLEDMECIVDNEGKSKAQVKKYYDRNKTYYLKIERVNSEVEREIGMYQWLKGKLPVPAIVYQAIIDDTSYLLMEKAKGQMLEDERFKNNPELLVRLAAKGINRLQRVDISECIYNSTIEYKLMKAKEFIANGVSISIGESIYTKGISTVEDVYNYLVKHKQEEELVFTHGDYCFNNYFTDGENITGYIDMGRGGVGDKYQDIALCVRELRDYDSRYTDLLFELLGIEPDYEKIKYYILLDELF
ncbi:MAG TPA: APH(3') family aminoglycoside O-phosphotransferase [Mobilitalea sp.]|nr:APH(3') family aminoglycoside O-phosphotransferase [Mobilitalea sp.]